MLREPVPQVSSVLTLLKYIRPFDQITIVCELRAGATISNPHEGEVLDTAQYIKNETINYVRAFEPEHGQCSVI